MNNRRSKRGKPAKTTGVSASANASGLQSPQEQKNEVVTLPLDLAAQRRAVKDICLNRVGANVLSLQMRTLINDGQNKTAEKVAALFVEAIKESVQPRDAIEEMLVLQMAWTHARLARLSAIASQQTQTKNVQVLNDACDRAAKSHVEGNPQRDFFITREMADKVIDACSRAEWKLIFALSRFGGLRCPSEHLALVGGSVIPTKKRRRIRRSPRR